MPRQRKYLTPEQRRIGRNILQRQRREKLSQTDKDILKKKDSQGVFSNWQHGFSPELGRSE